MSQRRHHGLTCPATGVVGYARGRGTLNGAEPHRGGQVNGRVQGLRRASNLGEAGCQLITVCTPHGCQHQSALESTCGHPISPPTPLPPINKKTPLVPSSYSRLPQQPLKFRLAAQPCHQLVHQRSIHSN